MFKPCLNQKLSMNPSVSIIYYTSKTLKNGNHPLMLRIIQNRQTKYVSLGVNINPNFWDFKKNEPKRKTTRDIDFTLSKIKLCLQRSKLASLKQ